MEKFVSQRFQDAKLAHELERFRLIVKGKLSEGGDGASVVSYREPRTRGTFRTHKG